MESKIQELISKMTVEEKIGQLNMEFIGLTGERIEQVKQLAREGRLGACILAAHNHAGDSEQEQFLLSELNEVQRCAVEESRLGIPLIFSRDVIHGYRTIFPIPLAQMATWDYDAIKEAASIMAKEASNEGIHLTFAPMLDICADPRWGRVDLLADHRFLREAPSAKLVIPVCSSFFPLDKTALADHAVLRDLPQEPGGHGRIGTAVKHALTGIGDA